MWGEGLPQRAWERKINTAYLVPCCGSVTLSREKLAERLAQLEAENLDLRHRVVELALQIQTLGMKVAR